MKAILSIVTVTGLAMGTVSARASAVDDSYSDTLHATKSHIIKCGNHQLNLITPVSGDSLNLKGPAGTRIFAEKANAHHIRWADSIKCSPRVSSDPPKSTPNASTSQNWSGYVAPVAALATKGFDPTIETSTTFNVPRIDGLKIGSYFESFWTGVGGYGGGRLVQAGVSSVVKCQSNNPSTCGQVNNFFIEMVPEDKGETIEEVGGKALLPGNKVDIDVRWMGKKAYYELCNLTQNVCASFTENVPTIPPVTSTVETITEATTVNGVISPLGNYHSVTYTQNSLVAAGSTDMVPMSAIPDAHKVTMVSADQTRALSTPGSINKQGGFATTWSGAK